MLANSSRRCWSCSGQLAPLLGDALRHLRESLAERRDLVAALARQPGRRHGALQRVDAIGLEPAHCDRQLPQRAGDQVEGGQPREQAQQRHESHRPQRGAQHAAGGDVGGQRVALLAEQHHVDIAGVTPVDAQRCSAEHLADGVAARIVAQDGQRLAGQQAPDRRHVHLIALQVSRRRCLRLDAAVRCEQVDLDARD